MGLFNVQTWKKKFRFGEFLDKTKFKTIFCIWLIIIALFGSFYFMLSFTNTHSIIYNGAPVEQNIGGLFDSVYFSFITATTLGYGDIAPQGFAKILAAIEAVLGLIMFGFLISKIVSSKQDLMLEEIYDIAFEQNIDRLRSALYLFREDLNKIIAKINHKKVTKREVNDLWIVMTTFDNALIDIYKNLCPSRKHKSIYHKRVEGVRLELIFNSLGLSLQRLLELVLLLDFKQYPWRNDTIISSMKSDVSIVQKVIEYYKNKSLDKKNFDKLADIQKTNQDLKQHLEVLESVNVPREKEVKAFGELLSKENKLEQVPELIH